MIDQEHKILIIVESPNKCKTISSFLPKNYKVMASVGHIMEIKNGGSYFNTGIDPQNKFKTNYAISPDKKEVVDKLKEQVSKSDFVYIATDPDREGEAIAWSLKKFLSIPKDKYKRITFHEITKNAVLNAIENPSDIDGDLVCAAQTRQKLDKLLGYRLSTISRKEINARSVGRCQSAGLKILVDRENEIRNFVPETYFDLYLNFTKNNTPYKAKYIGTTEKLVKKIKSKEEVDKIIGECNKTNKYVVDDIIRKEKLVNPKAPFTTSTFQQEVSNKLGIGVKDAMSLAQKLFEGIEIGGQHIALITYIRTDSNEFAPEFLPILENYVKKHFGLEYFAPMRKYKKSELAQEGHEAIRPVDLDMTPEMLKHYIKDNSLVKVYTMIYNRTLATMMASSVISETTYSILNGKHNFNLVSSELIFDGFKKIYTYKEDDEDEGVSTDTFDKGELLQNTQLNGVEKKTTPPPRFKEATFIKELESTGIGRPSTFATIVNTLLDTTRGYCTLENKNIVPTDKGMELSSWLDKSFSNLINVNYTSELEKDLDLIAKGKLDDIKFLEEFYNNMESSIKSLNKENRDKQHIVGEEKCPICGSNMYLRTGKYGDFWGCSQYPRCKGILKK